MSGYWGFRKWGRGSHCEQNRVFCWCDEKVELESSGVVVRHL